MAHHNTTTMDYYLTDNPSGAKVATGPYTREELRSSFESGNLSRNFFVSVGEDGPWTTINEWLEGGRMGTKSVSTNSTSSQISSTGSPTLSSSPLREALGFNNPISAVGTSTISNNNNNNNTAIPPSSTSSPVITTTTAANTIANTTPIVPTSASLDAPPPQQPPQQRQIPAPPPSVHRSSSLVVEGSSFLATGGIPHHANSSLELGSLPAAAASTRTSGSDIHLHHQYNSRPSVYMTGSPSTSFSSSHVTRQYSAASSLGSHQNPPAPSSHHSRRPSLLFASSSRLKSLGSSMLHRIPGSSSVRWGEGGSSGGGTSGKRNSRGGGGDPHHPPSTTISTGTDRDVELHRGISTSSNVNFTGGATTTTGGGGGRFSVSSSASQHHHFHASPSPPQYHPHLPPSHEGTFSASHSAPPASSDPSIVTSSAASAGISAMGNRSFALNPEDMALVTARTTHAASHGSENVSLGNSAFANSPGGSSGMGGGGLIVDRRSSQPDLSVNPPHDPSTVNFTEELSILASEMSMALERVSLLQSADSYRLRAARLDTEFSKQSIEDLKRENLALKAALERARPTLESHAPSVMSAIQDDLARAAAASSSTSSPTMTTNFPLAPSLSPSSSNYSFQSVPFEADSPMLTERMEHFESDIDFLRQSIKLCVKSGAAFISTHQSHLEAGLAFANDLQQTQQPHLVLLGQCIAELAVDRDKLLYSIDQEFVQPLAKFSRDEMKLANHARSELERKREAFEVLEARFVAHGGKGISASSASSAHHHVANSNISNSSFGTTAGHLPSSTSSVALNMLMSSASNLGMGSSSSSGINATIFGTTTNNSSSGNYNPATLSPSSLQFPPEASFSSSSGGSPDKLSSEMRNALVNFEVSRCRLIKELNLLSVKSVREISSATMAVLRRLDECDARARAVVQDALNESSVSNRVDEATVSRRMEEIERHFAEKTAQVEQQRVLAASSAARRAEAEPDVYFEGWLYKRSSNVIRDWKKRFFQIKGSTLYYFRGYERVPCVEEIALCTIRDGAGGSTMISSSFGVSSSSSSSSSTAPNAHLIFEIISTKKSVVLLATSEEEKDAWVAAMRSAIERQLTGVMSGANSQQPHMAGIPSSSSASSTVGGGGGGGHGPGALSNPNNVVLPLSSTYQQLLPSGSPGSLSSSNLSPSHEMEPLQKLMLGRMMPVSSHNNNAPLPSSLPTNSMVQQQIVFGMGFEESQPPPLEDPSASANSASHDVATPVVGVSKARRESENGVEPESLIPGWDPANECCAECLTPYPTWVSINLGVFFCIACSGYHRGMGTHISKVRSLQLDRLSVPQLEILRRIGNGRAAKIWEFKEMKAQHSMLGGAKEFIRDKYEKRLFTESAGDPTDPSSSPDAEEIVGAAARDDLVMVASFMARYDRGCLNLPASKRKGYTPLHAAAESGSAALCEFLLLNGANASALDDLGRRPLDVARSHRNFPAQQVLHAWGADSKYGGVVAVLDL